MLMLTTDSEKPKGVRFKDGKGVFRDGNYSYEGEWTKDLANGEGYMISLVSYTTFIIVQCQRAMCVCVCIDSTLTLC